KQRSPTLPVILVTGSLNEEKAVEFMKAGAADYILKDHLTRLPEAIRRALRERALREEREQAVAALRESEAQYRSLFESTPYPMWVFDLDRGQGVVKVVRQAGGGPTYRFHLLPLPEFLLDPLPPLDVIDHHLLRLPAGERNALTAGLDFDERSVLLAVPPRAGRMVVGGHGREMSMEGGDVFGQPQILDPQRKEFFARVSVMRDRGAVHRQDAVRLQVEHPHGVWRALEQGAVLGLRLPQRGDGLLALFAERPLTQGPTDRLGQSRQ